MKISVCVDVNLEDVESMTQTLETCSDENLKGFIEQVLRKVHEQSELLIEDFEAFEKLNPFSMCKKI